LCACRYSPGRLICLFSQAKFRWKQKRVVDARTELFHSLWHGVQNGADNSEFGERGRNGGTCPNGDRCVSNRSSIPPRHSAAHIITDKSGSRNIENECVVCVTCFYCQLPVFPFLLTARALFKTTFSTPNSYGKMGLKGFGF
jgi:hypothetical protein